MNCQREPQHPPVQVRGHCGFLSSSEAIRQAWGGCVNFTTEIFLMLLQLCTSSSSSSTGCIHNDGAPTVARTMPMLQWAVRRKGRGKVTAVRPGAQQQ